MADTRINKGQFGRTANAACGAMLMAAMLGCGGDDSNDQLEFASSSRVNWQSPVLVASGDGVVGPWRMNESTFHYVDDPTVAIADNGDALVAWVDNQAQTIFFQRYDSNGEATLPEPIPVSESPEVFSWLPRVASPNGGDSVLVAWEEILFTGGSHGGEILVARSDDGGRSFAEPVNLSRTTGGAGKGRLSPERWDNGSLDLIAHGDRAWVAWTEYEGELRLARSEDGGQSFEPALHISGSAEQPTRAPALLMLADERIVLAWIYGEESSADVQLAVSRDHGASFEVLGPALRREGHADAPRLAEDEQGGVHLVFAESPSGPGGPARLVYARASDDLKFGEPRVLLDLDGNQVHAGFPQLLISGSNLVVNWEILHHSRRSLGMGMIHSPDLGESFGQPEVVPGTEAPDGGIGGGLQGLLMRKTAIGADGQLLLTYSHFVPEQRSEVLLLRGQLPRR